MTRGDKPSAVSVLLSSSTVLVLSLYMQLLSYSCCLESAQLNTSCGQGTYRVTLKYFCMFTAPLKVARNPCMYSVSRYSSASDKSAEINTMSATASDGAWPEQHCGSYVLFMRACDPYAKYFQYTPHICMYVCMYVCMHRMYKHTYICTYLSCSWSSVEGHGTYVCTHTN